MNYKGILNIVSLGLIAEGLIFIICILVALYFGDPTMPFIISSVIAIVSGLILYMAAGKKSVTLTGTGDAFRVLFFTLLSLIAAGSLPYFLSRLNISTIDILWETTSGITTTGSTIFPDIAILPKSLIFWRSISQWLGGIGGLMLVVMVLPALNTGGYRFFTLRPSLRMSPFRVDRIILTTLIVFGTLTLAESLLLWAGGTGLFNSLCYSFSTMSCSGFSPTSANTMVYPLFFRSVMAAFMILAGISYLFYYRLISGEPVRAFKNEELITYGLLLLAGTVLIGTYMLFRSGYSFGRSISGSFLRVVSALSNTGNLTGDLGPMTGFPWLIILLLVFIGGCTSSPGGGIKISRMLIVFKNFKSFLHSDNSKQPRPVRLDGTVLTSDASLSVLTYLLIFGFIFLIGTLAVAFTGVSPEKSVIAALSSLTLYKIDFCCTIFPASARIILCLLMFIGRLELITVFALIGSLIPGIQHRQYPSLSY